MDQDYMDSPFSPSASTPSQQTIRSCMSPTLTAATSTYDTGTNTELQCSNPNPSEGIPGFFRRVRGSGQLHKKAVLSVFKSLDVPDEAEKRFEELMRLFKPGLYAYIANKTAPYSVYWEIRMVGLSEQDAQPMSVFHSDKKNAKKIETFFKQDHIQDTIKGSKIDLNFPAFYTNKPPRQLSHNTNIISIWTASSHGELPDTACGLPIAATLGDSPSRATIGGNLLVDGELFGMTVEHLITQILSSADEVAQGENNSTSISPHDIKLKIDGDSPDSEIDSSDSSTPENFDLTQGRKIASLDCSQLECRDEFTYLDWALIHLPQDMVQPNWVYESRMSSSETKAADIPLDIAKFGILVRGDRKDVILLSGNSYKPAILRSQSASLLMSPGTNFCDTLTVSPKNGFDLQYGDSGSWVVDPHRGEVYGHLIAGTADGDGLVIPVQATLEDMKKVTKASTISLPTAQETRDSSTKRRAEDRVSRFWQPSISPISHDREQSPRFWLSSRNPSPQQDLIPVTLNSPESKELLQNKPLSFLWRSGTCASETKWSSNWLHTGTWPKESTLLGAPGSYLNDYDIKAAPSLWEHGSFNGLAALPYPHFDTNQQHNTAIEMPPYVQYFNAQPHVQLLNGQPRGGSTMLDARPSALPYSFSSVSNSSSPKRHYSHNSSSAYEQGAAYISPSTISLQVPRDQPRLPQYDQDNPPLTKHPRLAQMPYSGVRFDALSRDEAPQVIAQVDQRGHAHGYAHVFGARQKVRRDMTASESARTKRIRKLEACNRCKALKQRCDRPASDFMPCANCLKARHSVRSRPADALCIRVKLIDLNLHRNGTTGTTFLKDWMYRKDTLVYHSALPLNIHRRTIQLSQGIHGIVLDVPVVQYITGSEDKTWYVWKDSKQKQRFMNMPPYYICDMESAREDLLAKMEQDTAGEYLLSLLRKDDDIVREAFCEAHRLKRSPLLSAALNIWCGTRFTELTWTICGEDKLECTLPTETDNPWYGTVPVTPIMDTQLDEIAINTFLKPYDGQFLQELQRKMTNPDTTDWYEVLLALFIILHNFQRMFIDVVEYTTRHGMEESKSRGGTSLSERNVHACKSLLGYFHFAYLGSRRFFSVLKKGEEMESMPEEQQKFLHTLHRFMSKEDQLKDWQQRNMYHDPMFWIIQLLIPDWKGDFKLCTPIDGFTEEDLLTT